MTNLGSGIDRISMSAAELLTKNHGDWRRNADMEDITATVLVALIDCLLDRRSPAPVSEKAP